MSETTKIERDRLAEYFEDFTKRFLREGAPDAADIEVLTGEMGDQYVAEGVHLLGVTYDPNDNSLEFELESGDHRIVDPQEVWAVEDDDGFVSAIEVVRPDSTKEIVRVRRAEQHP